MRRIFPFSCQSTELMLYIYQSRDGFLVNHLPFWLFVTIALLSLLSLLRPVYYNNIFRVGLQNLTPNIYVLYGYSFNLISFCESNAQFLQLHLDPASSNTLPASGDGSITQKLKVSNSQHGKVR